MKTLINISIPENLQFSDLKLSRDSDGMVSFDRQVIESICEFNSTDPEIFFNAPEDNVAQLIMYWYSHHINSGGKQDQVAEDLIAEVMAEDRLGAGISHKPGQA